VVDEVTKLSYVPLDQVQYVWSSQLEMVEKAMAKGQADWGSAADLLSAILKEKSLLWAVHQGDDILAVVVTCVDANKHMRKMFVQLLAGDGMEHWIEHQQTLLEFADYAGVECIEASCRPGLAKFLKGHGWSQKAIIMELRDG
jgi:hypothetical protein